MILKRKLHSLYRRLSNLPGYHTNRKIILFLSDDWGGVRVFSNQARQNLIKAGIDMGGNRFDRYDTLESNQDLEYLFEVLLKYKDHKGNHPVITAVCNVANPDFKRIKASGFSEYFFEPFTETLKRYPNHDRVFEYYQKGIETNIFRPEFHGREHLQVNWWLMNLQANNKIVRNAFDNFYWYLQGKYLISPLHRSLGAAYDIASVEEINPQNEIIISGVQLFEDIFGYEPCLFVPPEQHFHQDHETAIAYAKLKMIDVPSYRKMPLGNGKFSKRLHFAGQKASHNLRYIIRNAVFEPNIKADSYGVYECLAGIERAFRFRKPAIISNHRASFTGSLDDKNRAKGLKALNLLLHEILKRWPDSEFVNATRFYDLMFGQ